MTTNNDDQLEPAPGHARDPQLPALVGAHDAVRSAANHGLHKHASGAGDGSDEAHQQGEAEQYELHGEHTPILPGQILTDTIARLRFIVVIVSFFYSGLFFVIGIVAVCLVAPNLLYLMDRTSPILLHTARLLISLISIVLACICIFITFKQRELTGKLALAEVMIDNIRDMALIQMQATRYNLEDLTERLKFQNHSHPSPFDYIALARKIGPIVSLLMSKERSVMTMAVEGVKIFQVIRKLLNK